MPSNSCEFDIFEFSEMLQKGQFEKIRQQTKIKQRNKVQKNCPTLTLEHEIYKKCSNAVG